MTNGDGGKALWRPIVESVLAGDHPCFSWLATFYGGSWPAGRPDVEEPRQA